MVHQFRCSNIASKLILNKTETKILQYSDLLFNINIIRT